MSEEPDWKTIRDERTALVHRVLSQPFAEAWKEVRGALSAVEIVGDVDDGPRVYTLPTRSYLLPLPWELLRGFVSTFGSQALDALFTCSSDGNPVLAAYALHALDEHGDSRLYTACRNVASRSEPLSIVGGCFVRSLTLAEYANELFDDVVPEPKNA